jgi:hypothetical protein
LSFERSEAIDIVLLPFPFSSDLDKQKQRPAMVVSSSSYDETYGENMDPKKEDAKPQVFAWGSN